MKRLFTTVSLTVLFVSGALQSLAQNGRIANPALPYNGEMCGSAYIHKELLQNDPVYKKNFVANEQRIEEIIANQKAGRYGQNSVMSTVYTIPVVVHVIHLGEAVGTNTNISDAQIQSAINNLNTAYRNQSPYNGIDIEVQFALAQRDPNCNATTGINRVNGSSVSGYTTSGCTRSGTPNETAVKALSKWPNTTYYNIWVVAGIDGNMGGGGVQGYAYFPGAGSDVDGAVMLFNAFGYDPTGTLGYNLKSYTNHNGTAIHELGHAFNLYHSFEGDDANSDGTADQCPSASGCGSGAGDCCADTPPHKRSSSDCNTSGTNSCDGGSSNSLFVHNFMDYSSDACKYQFTSDQKTRMRAAIYASRGSLINNLATTAPSGSLPASACTSTPAIMDGDYQIGVYGFTFNDLDVNSGTTYEDGGNVDRTCFFQTTVTAGNSYPMTVNVGTSNPQNAKVYIDYNGDGTFASGESVFSFTNGTGAHTGTVTIPGTATTGTKLRMRVFTDFVNYSITSACQTPQYGQYEDYAITINAAAGSPPVANFSGSPTSVCVGSSVTFTDASTNSPTSWSWTFQGGNPATSSSQNPVVSYTAAGTYSVSLTATNASGSNTMNKTAYITVNGKPTVTANASANPICSGSSTTLSGGGASTYTWTGGVTNGSSVSPSSTSSYTVTGTDGNGCTNTAAITVSVSATPTVNVSGTTTITSGSSTTLTASGGTTYVWTPSTGLNATTGSVVVANPTVTTAYTVTGTSGSCSGTKTFTITVSAPVGPCHLQPAYCGITETSLTQYLYCVPITNATNYAYEFTDQTTGTKTYYLRGYGVTDMQLYYAGNFAYSRTYAIRVAAYVSGAWTYYGTSCNVTTPSAPTTSLQPSYCGITETDISQVLYCTPVTGATSYAYQITDVSTGSVVTTYVRQGNSTDFAMSWASNVTYGKTYSIKVSAQVGGTWINYGNACTVTTPGVPTTKLASAYCNIVESSFSQVLYCDPVASATNYRYVIVDPSNGNTFTYTRGNSTDFSMSWVTGLTTNKTYNVQVAPYVGTWLPYGTTCSVTTAASFAMNPGDVAEQNNGGAQARTSSIEGGIALNVYPNPNDGHVYLNVNKDMTVVVTNVLGEKVYEGEVKNGVNELYFLDAKPGMYIIRVSDGENATQVRMIKN